MLINDSTYRPTGLGAAFNPAFEIVQRNEGCYVNNPNDPGGETYAGIARKIHPSWSGWTTIDKIKSSRDQKKDEEKGGFSFLSFFGFGGIDFNECVPTLKNQVTLFYLDQWNASRSEQLASQKVANNYFDLYILSSQAQRLLQQAINRIGGKVAVDNRIGPQTISAANRLDEDKLNSALVSERKEWHEGRVAAGLSPSEFLTGWVKRALSFGSELSQKNEFLIASGAILLAIAGYQIYKNQNSQKNGGKNPKSSKKK